MHYNLIGPFLCRIVFEKNAKHTTGNVVHSSGRTVVSASTSEYGISKFLYRNTDLSAAENIGRVLARRMLETGIVSAYCDFTKEEREGTRVRFLQTDVQCNLNRLCIHME